jgi:hypothetical protein
MAGEIGLRCARTLERLLKPDRVQTCARYCDIDIICAIIYGPSRNDKGNGDYMTGALEDCGCVFVVEADGQAGSRYCGAPRRPGSAYCPEHHDRCRLPEGSKGARRRLREIEALAEAVGGKIRSAARQPSDAELDRLERVSLRPTRSRYVRAGEPLRKSSAKSPPNTSSPTAERLRHGPIERVERPIADSSGRLARPYRSVDTLVLMERRGSITAGMRQAGEDFRARFTIAQLDPLRAVDLGLLRFGDGGARPDCDGPGLRIEAARRSVWQAIQAVGGLASPAGSCLWHVLGWERSVKEWALEQGWSGRRVSQESASGILIAALGALEAHFRAS